MRDNIAVRSHKYIKGLGVVTGISTMWLSQKINRKLGYEFHSTITINNDD